MTVPVMGIRYMGMPVPFRLVPMRVAVLAVGHEIMRVVVMPVVVTVSVFMVQRLVLMLMLVRLGQMQGHASSISRPPVAMPHATRHPRCQGLGICSVSRTATVTATDHPDGRRR